jgi:outer membrane protein assembly factor BamB
MTRRSGTEEWRQAALLRRWPTLPVPFHTAVVAGDFKGYLHFFSNVDGEPVARTRLGKKAISGAPYVAADRLFVQSDSGSLHAFVAVEEEPERKEEEEPETQDEEA